MSIKSLKDQIKDNEKIMEDLLVDISLITNDKGIQFSVDVSSLISEYKKIIEFILDANERGKLLAGLRIGLIDD